MYYQGSDVGKGWHQIHYAGESIWVRPVKKRDGWWIQYLVWSRGDRTLEYDEHYDDVLCFGSRKDASAWIKSQQ
jgi:hypothetical protein